MEDEQAMQMPITTVGSSMRTIVDSFATKDDVSHLTKVPSQYGHKKKRTAIKIQRARYPLLILVRCLVWIVLGLLSINLGLRGTRNLLKLFLQETTTQYLAMQYQFEKSDYLHTHLGILQEQRLDRRLFETHDECLVRATKFGHISYGGIPYGEYPYILNKTVEWAEEQCGKLHFAPQVPNSQSQIILQNALSSIGKTAGWICQWVNETIWGRIKILSKERINDVEHPLFEAKKSDKVAHPELPPYYELNCSSDPVCHISYKTSVLHSSIVELVAKEKIATTERSKRDIIATIGYISKAILWEESILTMLVIPLQMLGIFVIIATFLYLPYGGIKDDNPRFNVCTARLPAEENRTAGLLVIQTVLSLLSEIALKLFMQRESWPMVCMCTLLVSGGIGILAVFFTPVETCFDNVTTLMWTIEELYDVWRIPVDDIPAAVAEEMDVGLLSSIMKINFKRSNQAASYDTNEAQEKSKPRSKDEDMVWESNEIEETGFSFVPLDALVDKTLLLNFAEKFRELEKVALGDSSISPTTSDFPRRRISTKTSLDEDIEQVQQAMYEERDNHKNHVTQSENEDEMEDDIPDLVPGDNFEGAVKSWS